VIVMLEILWHASRIGDNRLRSPMKDSRLKSATVRILAVLLIMSQESTRFVQAFSNSFTWLFWRVDWHFGQNLNWVAASKRNNAMRALFYALVLYVSVGGLGEDIVSQWQGRQCVV
jgi:hypothetical protein